MERKFIKNRQVTEPALIKAVDELIEKKSFERLGVNTIATKAGISKMLIYHHFNSLEGLIAIYIGRHDCWINLDGALPDKDHLGEFIKKVSRKQIIIVRRSYALKRLYRWRLTSNNSLIKDLREKGEVKGIWLVDAASGLSKHPQKEIAALTTIIIVAISYLTLLEENCSTFNGLRLQEESGWKELEDGINILMDPWLEEQ